MTTVQQNTPMAAPITSSLYPQQPIDRDWAYDIRQGEIVNRVDAAASPLLQNASVPPEAPQGEAKGPSRSEYDRFWDAPSSLPPQSAEEKRQQEGQEVDAQVGATAEAFVNAAIAAAPIAIDAAATVANAAATVAIPMVDFAWNLMKGAGNFVLASSSQPIDPAALQRRQFAEARLQLLTNQYRLLERDEWEYDRRETYMISLPALSGYMFGGFSGLATGMLMGYVAARVCRTASQSFIGYKQKRAQADQIRGEIHTLSSFLGVREPQFRPIFR